MLLRKGRKGALGIAHDIAGLTPYPQRTVWFFMQPIEAIAGEAGAVRGVEDREAVAIETNEAVEGRHPEVAVLGLDDVVDMVDGQAIFNGEVLDEVIRMHLIRRRLGQGAMMRQAEEQQATQQQRPAAHSQKPRADGRHRFIIILRRIRWGDLPRGRLGKEAQ